MAEEGFFYDSSMLRIVPPSSGSLSTGERFPRLQLEGHTLWEIVPSTFNMLGFGIPVGGDGYLRALSYPFLHGLFSRIEDRGEPLVLYTRAWELDADQPRMKGTVLAEFRHYLNLHKMASRLHQVLTDFHFGPVRDVIWPIQALPLRSAPFESSLLDKQSSAPLSIAM